MYGVRNWNVAFLLNVVTFIQTYGRGWGRL